MKIFKHLEFTGTQTINLGKLSDGNAHPVDMYITLPESVSSVSVQSETLEIGAYSVTDYAKADEIVGPGSYIAIVAPYETLTITAVGEGTVKVDLYE